MSRSMQLYQAKAPTVGFQHGTGNLLVLKKPAEGPWTVRQAVELFHQLTTVEALLKSPTEHLSRAFCAEQQEKISVLLGDYQQVFDTLQPSLTLLLEGISSPSALTFTQEEVSYFEQEAVGRLTDVVTQLDEVTGWLEESLDFSHLSSVISTIFVFSSLLSAVVSLTGVLLALAFPPLLAPLISLTFACAHAVHHLGNKLYETEKQHVLSDWNHYRKSLSDFALQLKKFKESTMFSAIYDQGIKVQQLEEVVHLMRQQLNEQQQVMEQMRQGGVANAIPPVRTEALTEETIQSTLPITGIPLSPPGNLSFGETAQHFVNTRFAEGLSYDQIRQAGINELDAALADHQAGRHQQQQHAQDNLAAIQKGN